MRVWDVFPYWREQQFVEARRKLWATYAPDVQHIMVACIGDRTHRGDPLPPDLPEPEVDFKVEVTLDAEGNWGRERQQRDAGAQFVRFMLHEEKVSPEDIVLIADADELTDPRRIRAIAASTIYRPAKMGMHAYLYGLMWRFPRTWWQAAAGRARDIANINLSEMRVDPTGYVVLPDCGWHISYVGGMDAIDQKLKAFAHEEWDSPGGRAVLAEGIEKGLDMSGGALLPYPLESEIAECLTSIPKSRWS